MNPYMWNHLYNLKASNKVTDVIKPVSANPMGADLTPVSGYESLTKSGTDQVPHSIGMMPDILLGTQGSNGQTYDQFIELMKDETWDPVQVPYQAVNSESFVQDMYNLSDAMKQVQAKSGKTGRYGDTEIIAKNYEAYMKGIQCYIIQQQEAGAIKPKTVAIIDPTGLENGKYEALDSTVSKGTAASCRAAEYVENTSKNIIQTQNIPNTGTEGAPQYIADAKDIVKADAIIATVQAQIQSTSDEIRKDLADKAGIDIKDVPPVLTNDPEGIFSIRANSVENFVGFGFYNGFLYPEVLNPTYAYTYVCEKFYHVTEPGNRNALAETNLANASFPEGYTADTAGYTTNYIQSRINAGMNYYFKNAAKYQGTRLEVSSRLSASDFPATSVTQQTSISKAAVSAIANKAYTGKQLKPAVTVKVSGKTLKSGTDYTVAYKNNIKPGKATVTITGKGNYTGTKTATFMIVPKKATVAKATSKKSGALTVTWKKDSTATGYQVIAAKNSKMTSGKKTANITKVSTASKTFTKLTKGKKYYAKVRAYKTIGGKKYYGALSSAKTATVKK